MIVCRRLTITGKVQGVFYRASAKQIAGKLNISGWIKNTIDESVEAFIMGEEEKIDQFILWCRQGPPMAEVTDIYIEECAAEKVSGFEIRK